MEFIKQHNICLSEVFQSEAALNAHELECEKYKSEFELIKAAMKKKTLPVRGGFGSFVPYLQHVRLDALNASDHPNGIAENSIYVDLKIDMKERKFEVSGCGSIWLTDAEQKASYLCMCSMRKAVEKMGGNWMRKSKFKDADDLARKVCEFWNRAMECVSRATGGYPYKQMQVNIY